MASNYRYAADDEVLRFLTRLEPDEQALLLSAFDWLASRPNEVGAASHRDFRGRFVQAHFFGRYTVVAWTDHAVSEVRIVEVLAD